VRLNRSLFAIVLLLPALLLATQRVMVCEECTYPT
jgi:hypothetical protein